jgi:hypothetical protein
MPGMRNTKRDAKRSDFFIVKSSVAIFVWPWILLSKRLNITPKDRELSLK